TSAPAAYASSSSSAKLSLISTKESVFSPTPTIMARSFCTVLLTFHFHIGLCLERCQHDGVDDIVHRTGSLQNVCRFFYAHQEWAEYLAATELLQEFVSDIARIQIREDKNICPIFNFIER